jgi:hypothetical protein
VLIASVGIETSGRTGASIVFNGTESLTLKSRHTNAGGDQIIEWWHRVNPTATTANCVLTFGGGTARASGAYTRVTGAHQTTPLGTAGVSEGSGNRSVTITDGATNDLVIDHLMDQAGDAAVGAGQTLRWGPLSNAANVNNGSTEPGAASVTMSWTLSGFAAFQAAINIKQATGADTTLAAVLSGAGSLAGALSTDITMAAALAGSAQLAAQLTTQITMAAQLAGSGSLAGALTTDIRFASALTASATLAAQLTTEIRLAAQLAGSASLAGALTTAIELRALLAGSGSLSAQLEVIVLNLIKIATVFGAAPACSTALGAVPTPAAAQGAAPTLTAPGGAA